MRKYVKTNKELFRMLKRDNIKINNIKAVRKGKGILNHIFISSYRVDYDIIDMKG